MKNDAAARPPVPLLTAKEVLAIVKIGRTTLYRLIAEGSFPPPAKIGSASRWRSDEIAAWIDEATGAGMAGQVSPYWVRDTAKA